MDEDTSNEEVVEETVAETPETTESEPSSEAVEPREEKPLYAGKYKSAEELEKAYQEAQRLISEQGQKLKASENPLPADKQAIIDELKALGVVTADDLKKQQAIMNQAQKDSLEIKELGLNQDQETVLRNYANSSANLSKSMTECWNELQALAGGKVVSRKTTIKPKPGNKTGFVEKSASELAKLPKAEYDKYWIDYANHKAGI